MRRLAIAAIAALLMLGVARADVAAPDAGEAALARREPARVEGISFDPGKPTLRAESQAALEAIVKLLARHPDWKLAVEVHTDSRGAEEWNRRLSQGRAEAVCAWLKEHGVDGARLEAVGVGEDKPLVTPEKSEADRAKNRRVELKRR